MQCSSVCRLATRLFARHFSAAIAKDSCSVVSSCEERRERKRKLRLVSSSKRRELFRTNPVELVADNDEAAIRLAAVCGTSGRFLLLLASAPCVRAFLSHLLH